MNKLKLIVLGTVAASLSLAALGCGGARSDPEAAADLRVLGKGFHNFNEDKKRGPRDADEFRPYIEADSKTAYPGLKDGRYVFQWNVGLRDIMPGTDEHVLGYERDVPTKGGPVLFGDGAVKNLTADQFKAAKLAKAKT